MKKLCHLLLLKFLFLLVLAVTDLSAQSAGLRFNLVLNSSKYLFGNPNDPLVAEITLSNPSGVPIVTSNGFSRTPFHLYLTFIDPDGKPITSPELGLGASDTAPPRIVPVGGAYLQVEEVEIIPNGFTKVITIPDLRAFYSLPIAGRYTVKAVVAFRNYSTFFSSGGKNYAPIDSFAFTGTLESETIRFSLIADADGDGYAYPEPDARISNFTVADCNDNDATVNPGRIEILDDGKDNDCNPATPDSSANETPVQALQRSIDTLNLIIANSPGQRFTDELRDALERARSALRELSDSRADAAKAVDRIKQVIVKLEQAADEGFNANQARDLMNQFTGVARQLAVEALNRAVAQNSNPKKIQEAQEELAKGDAQRAALRFERAVERYEKAIEDAEEALR